MHASGKKLNGSEIFFECLRRENVEYIFGYPGGALLKVYETLYDVKDIRHILVRHEQGATHMAEGYARATGKPGVVLVTSGPGATNTVTGITNAYMDSSPLVVFTGQVPSSLIGNDAFQEADIVGITRPITKHNFLVKDVKDLASTIRKAFFIATNGRPGPVLVDMPKDILNAECAFEWPESVDIRGFKPTVKCHQNQVEKAAHKIAKAKKPLLYIGGGVISANASEELRQLAIEQNIPVTMTLQGLGAFPGDHPLSMGMLGMHGTYWANQAVNNCDLLIAIGARFDDRVTGKTDTFATQAYIIHNDIDPTNVDKNIKVDLPVVGDSRDFLASLLKAMPKHTENRSEWLEQIRVWHENCPLTYTLENDSLKTEYVIDEVSRQTGGSAVVTTDVGQHQMWTTQYYRFLKSRSIITSGGLGTMGYGLPAAIGAAFGVTDRPVVLFCGDGGFMMNIQELVTAVYYKIPIKIFLINNSFLGMVRQWQELFHKEKYSFTDLDASNPDFVKVAEAFGCRAMHADNPEEAKNAITEALAYNDGPVLVDFRVIKKDMVFPMVPAGASVSDMLLKRLNPKTMV
ncbi:MAG: biosynthetic-type acetolactate synthase large subunit [Chlorobium sp.]|jgi:acetolactate synthase-1/2/3 large subunit|uniref:biosynthetic-type acetolactate synthase large subunit n=1 Tax=Chlorobium sp. TaxID=1095 RepID=UPI0025C1BC78|nr:biosynthetic-type acetolactate synthase large subunit [Chlorobium sp.]MCF8216940.1 biosynthetic-type acetolactate synthase large subunit [Chlorobium sp.]MCF8271769.1 biosynthetic-type acetolactate synthase large subunit [Chlorobium sp.]MCF8288157.1 biosynthetic-type acetolactate synthase large subunit [Chlorobium sp.]MCF8291748.1 biosynthetic-type acetolactate synthase large subunit [Chlorobium sp.]MCF8385840.1 biosynthetic-type acetolactate synthase large subunit [Chlorobium sp.]